MNEPRTIRKSWALAAAVAPVLVLAAAFLLQPGMTYNRWDNFEWFTPMLSYAHGQLLTGAFPHWNPHQFLGEPLHAQTQAGVLYLPYTLALLLARMTGLGDQGVTAVVLLIHLPYAGWGWYRLMRKCDVRPSLALLTAVSTTSGGFLTAVASVWIFTVPILTWIPWLLLGLMLLLDEPGRPHNQLLFVAGLTAVAFVGYAQLLIYVWVLVVLVAVAYACVVLRRPGRLAAVIVPALGAALLSAPAIFPTYDLLQYTQRADKVDLVEFLTRSVLPEALSGALLPLYGLLDGCFNPPASVMLYQGGWMVTAIGAALFFLVTGTTRMPSAFTGPGHVGRSGDQQLDRTIMAAAAVTLIFMLFALGGNGPLYPLTYGIPVWSSLRWPFKFLFLATPLLALTAGLAVEKCARVGEAGVRRRSAFAIGVLLVVLAVILLVRHPSPRLGSAAGMLCLAAGIPSLLLAGMAGARWARAALLVVVVVEAVGVVALCHDLGFKTYQEPLGAYGPAKLGMAAGFRVLPLTVPELLGERPAMQPYDLFVSATANGYDSATGCMWGMTPVWCARVLPADVSGVLPSGRVGALLDSNLLRSLNVRYVIAGRNDAQARLEVERAGGYRQVAEVDGAQVYDNGSDLPRAYFASEVYPYSEAGFIGGMIQNGVPLRSAFVEEGGDGVRSGPCPPGQVESARWNPNDVRLQVNAREGGFLVLSMTWYPEWRAAVDGRPVPICRVNGTLQGVAVPPGARKVELHYRPTSLYLGCAMAVGGLIMLAGWAGFARRWHVRPRPAGQ